MVRDLDLSTASHYEIEAWLKRFGVAAFLQQKFDLPALPHLDAVDDNTFVWHSVSRGRITVQITKFIS